jgi:hypothetical protein
VLLDKVGKGLVSKEAVVVEMAGGEYHRIKGMGMIMSQRVKIYLM